MSYTETFILIAPDSPVSESVVPVAGKSRIPAHVIQYELLSQSPYTYTEEDLIYEVHIRHKGIGTEDPQELAREREQLFQKNHPCMRASMLPKKYGWGVHYDAYGRIALYGAESEAYKQFARSGPDGCKLLNAMRSRRA